MKRGCLIGCAISVLLAYVNPVSCQLPDGVTLECSGGQFYPNPYNCGQFYQCLFGKGILRSCPVGLYFNPLTNNCDWPFRVNRELCSRERDEQLGLNNTHTQFQFIRKIGELSDEENYTESTTECPEGTVTVSCACTAPKNCSGSFIRGRKCTIYNSISGNKQQAVALCLTELTTDEVKWTESDGPFQTNPIASCPEGYHVISCNLWNPWAGTSYVHTKTNIELEQCEVDGSCTGGFGCIMQAVCRRNGSS